MIQRSMAGIHISDIEAAITHWRARDPVDERLGLRAELGALAEVYGQMVFYRQTEADEATMPAAAHAAWLAWFDSLPARFRNRRYNIIAEAVSPKSSPIQMPMFPRGV